MAKWILIILIGPLLLAYQNCSPTSFSNSATSSSNQQSISGSGQPYDGKIFIVDGKCQDKTLVTDRMVFAGSTAKLVREDCQDLDPAKIIPPAELTLKGDQVFYAAKIFQIERPIEPVVQKSSWYVQLQGSLSPRAVDYYEVDLFDTSRSTMNSLKSNGSRVVCMVSGGTSENWRSDSSRFRATDLGNTVTGAPNERWLNINSANVRAIMLERIELAVDKGCTIVDFDGVSGYSNNTGFSISRVQQVAYNQFLAFAVHNRKLQIALKTVPDLVPDLVGYFDIAIAEQCFETGTCGAYAPFTALEKAVLAHEYTAKSAAQCLQAEQASFSLIYVNQALNGNRFETCE